MVYAPSLYQVTRLVRYSLHPLNCENKRSPSSDYTPYLLTYISRPSHPWAYIYIYRSMITPVACSVHVGLLHDVSQRWGRLSNCASFILMFGGKLEPKLEPLSQSPTVSVPTLFQLSANPWTGLAQTWNGRHSLSCAAITLAFQSLRFSSTIS